MTGSVTRTFDTDFRVAAEMVNGANSVGFQYDPDSLLIGVGVLSLTRHPQNGLLTGSTLGGASDEYTYNTFGEVVTYQATYGESMLLSYQNIRDALGRITQKTETIGGITDTYTYAYDLAGRLTDVTKNGTLAAHYEYDANGNRLSVTRIGVGTVSGTYDAQDRLVNYGEVAYSFTDAGDLQSTTSGGQTTTYRYDPFGNLLAVSLPTGTDIDYITDGQHRRIGKQVNGVLTQAFLYSDQLMIVAELEGSGNIVSRFVYGTKLNVPEYMIRAGHTYRLVTGQLGSVRLVVDVATGAIAQRLDYDEFGQVLQDTNPGFQPFGFGGGLYDEQTGLVRFGFRDYEPFSGRWTAKDSILFLAGSANLYEYASNDPINAIDPSGLIVLPANPGGLPPCWKLDPTHQDPYGLRYRHPSGDILDFSKGREGEPGWRGRDHWHYNKGKKHLLPGSIIPGGDCPETSEAENEKGWNEKLREALDKFNEQMNKIFRDLPRPAPVYPLPGPGGIPVPAL